MSTYVWSSVELTKHAVQGNKINCPLTYQQGVERELHIFRCISEIRP